jgi:hypothetical protein
MGTEIGPKEPPVFAVPAGCTKTGELSHRSCEPESSDPGSPSGASGDRRLGKLSAHPDLGLGAENARPSAWIGLRLGLERGLEHRFRPDGP